jgi:predicted glycosyltransferase
LGRPSTSRPAAVRVWVDITAPAHPLVFRPIIERLRRSGHEVFVTARDYAQTLELLDLHGIEHVTFGRHGGASRARKLVSLMRRTLRMRRWGAAGFDLAAAHGSNELPLAAHWLGIPAVNMFDYEWATQQHRIGCRLAHRVITPEAIPPERLRRYGVGPEKLAQYPGLKEEYYLADFEPDEHVLEAVGVDRARILVVLRPPPEVSLYHRRSNRLFPRVVNFLGRRDDVQAVVLPRTESQRRELRHMALPSLMVPDHAVEAQSLIALSDLVVSAGGTMNREAAALGVPVYTIYGGRLGGVDEALIREQRLRPLTDPRAIRLEKRRGNAPRVRRDAGILSELVIGGRDG